MEFVQVLLDPSCNAMSPVRHLRGAGISEGAAGVIQSFHVILRPSTSSALVARPMFTRTLFAGNPRHDVAIRGRALLVQVKMGLRFLVAEEWAYSPTVEGAHWISDVSSGNCSVGCP